MDGSGPKDIRSPIQSEPKTPLSPAQIAFRQYFRESFRFTQGSSVGQSFVNEWVIAAGLMPDVDLPRIVPTYIRTVHPPGIHLKNLQDPEDEITDAYNDIRRLKRDQDLASSEKSLDKVLDKMLEMELKYQIRGRRGRSMNDDMFDSYMRRYLVLGEATGSPILDKLAVELRRKLDELRERPREEIDPEVKSEKVTEITRLLRLEGWEENALSIMRELGQRELLALVEEYWELNHSGKKFYPEEALSTAE